MKRFGFFVAVTLLVSLPIFAAQGQLSFYLNAARQIEAYSAQGMDYYEDPSKFEGQDIIEVLPLDKATKDRLLKKYDLATKENKIVVTHYDFQGQEYATKITPLKRKAGNSYFVTVWKADSESRDNRL